MKIVVSNIDWDYPGKGNGTACPFPSSVVIDNVGPFSPLLDDIDGDAANIAEHLTAEYECCVCGFSAEVEEVDGDD